MNFTEETRCEPQSPKAEVSGRMNEAAGRDGVDTLSVGGGRKKDKVADQVGEELARGA